MPEAYLSDSFALHADAQGVMNRLRAFLPELSHTKDARIVCIASQIEPRLHGHPCRAFICDPKVQGPLRHWFGWALAEFCHPVLEGESPDYLVVFDAALWASMSSQQREILMYHELLHLHAKEDLDSGAPKLDDEGRPLLTIAPHDTELFHAELRRYGPAALELDPLLQAIVDGQSTVARRKRAS
ncbi:MAG: putative metallopeptidase [Cetobacterium sp.]